MIILQDIKWFQSIFTLIKGIGTQVKKAVMSRNNFLPQTSERAPINGAERKLRKPLMPMIIPLYNKALSPKVVLRIFIIGAVMRPQAKNWRKTATTGCHTDGFLHLQDIILTKPHCCYSGSGNSKYCL